MFQTIIAQAIQSMCFSLSCCTALFLVSALFLNQTAYDGYSLFYTRIARAVCKLDLAVLVTAYATHCIGVLIPSLVADLLLMLVTLDGLGRCFTSIRNCAGTILAMHRMYCRLEQYARDHWQELSTETYRRMVENLRGDEAFRVYPRYQAYFDRLAAGLAEKLGLYLTARRKDVLILCACVVAICSSTVFARASIAKWILDDVLEKSIVQGSHFNFLRTADAPAPSSNRHHLTCR